MPSNLHDLILHGGIAVASSRRGSTSGVGVLVGGGSSLEVIGHLRIELLSGLLHGTAGATTTTGALLATTAGAGTLGVVALLVGSCGLRLCLGLGGALSEGLGGRNDFGGLGGTNDDLNLDRTSVDK